MTVSTMLQLKILKTKKRLSKDNSLAQITIMAAGLLLILSFMLRAVSLSNKFGSIELVIPQVAVGGEPVKVTDKVLTKDSVVVFLSQKNLYFGSVEAFGSEFNSVSNKFLVPHVNGKPNINRLIADIDKWRETNKRVSSDVLVFSSANDIPARIAIMTIAELKKSATFDEIIIGGGLL